MYTALTHNLQRDRIGYGDTLLAIDVARRAALVLALVLVGDVVDDQPRLVAPLHVLGAMGDSARRKK